MTANQIAYAEYLENKRHNEATENEIGRHNVATEELQGKQNSITERRVMLEDAWNREKNEIQKDYNRWYSEYQTAATDRKLDIEGYLANLKSREVENNRRYQEGMYLINQDANAVKREANEENERHNQAMESISTFGQLLTERRIEYENTFWKESAGVALYNADVNYLRTTTNADVEYSRLMLEQAFAPYKKMETFYSSLKNKNLAYPLGMMPLSPLKVDRDIREGLVEGHLKLFQ